MKRCLPPLILLLTVICMLPASADGSLSVPERAQKFDLLGYQAADGVWQPVDSVEGWQLRRAQILQRMQQVMGVMPGDERRCDLAVEVQEEVREGGCLRRRITFAPEPGDRVPAYLFIPEGLTGRVPAVLCLHQTTGIGKGEPAGIGGLENLHYALELARRGYVTLAPDYPNFGDYRFDAYAAGYDSATMKGIWNHMRAVDLLQSLDEVDPEAIGCIGHSLGGHNTLFVAAFDTRIKVAVTSCGFCSYFAYMGGDLNGWSHGGYMPRIASQYGARPEPLPFEFSEILGAIAPRAVFTNSPVGDDNFDVGGVKDCLAAAAPVYSLLGAPDHLAAEFPDCGHDFPPDVRERAYQFMDRVLRR